MPPVCFQYHPQTSRNQALIPGPRETHFRDWFARDSPLQRRVVRTMVTAATWSRTAASVSRLSLVSCFQVTSTPWGSDSSATGATPTLPTSASKATAFHVWLRRSVPDAEHLMRCPSRMAENTATRRFCAQCGTPLPSPCPSCGFENEPSARFCGGCGKPPRGDCRSSPSGRARVPRAPIAQNAANSRSCFAIWWAQRRCRRAMTPRIFARSGLPLARSISAYSGRTPLARTASIRAHNSSGPE